MRLVTVARCQIFIISVRSLLWRADGSSPSALVPWSPRAFFFSPLFSGALMKRAVTLSQGLTMFGLLFLSTSIPAGAYGEASNKHIASYDTNVLGVKLHYTMAGHGS